MPMLYLGQVFALQLRVQRQPNKMSKVFWRRVFAAPWQRQVRRPSQWPIDNRLVIELGHKLHQCQWKVVGYPMSMVACKTQSMRKIVYTCTIYKLVYGKTKTKAKLEMQSLCIDQTTPRSHILQVQCAYGVSSTRRIDTKTVWFYPANI